MKEETLFKIRKVLIRVGVGLFSLLLAYLVVYKFSYLPEGYKVISKEESEAVLSSYSLWGTSETINYAPREEADYWKVRYLTHEVHDLKLVYLLFFSAVFLCIISLIYEIKKSKPLIIIIWAKGASFALLISLISLIQHLGKINDLL